MYRESNVFANFHISGFQYYDGALVLKRMEPGDKLKMVAETDNPYDPNAIALYWADSKMGNDVKLGYVPKNMNSDLAMMLHYGHGDAFEAIVLSARTDAETFEQVYVSVRVVDATRG